MRAKLSILTAGSLLFSLAAIAYYSRSIIRKQVAQAALHEASLPRRVLWVWERPEDLHEIDPGTTGVAVLQETLRLSSSVIPVARSQPVLIPEHVSQIAVVRIETDQTFVAHGNDSALLQNVVANLDRISRQPGIAALQIDFDARKSERAFYRRLLDRLRRQMPPALPLDITALVSWCSTDDWISDLPINAATPMFFRMEPDRRRVLLNGAPGYHIREPLCSGSIGLSTTEHWAQNAEGKRTFLFADHGWAKDLANLHYVNHADSETRSENP
jgi:Protein of unknown function (DUF3142)